MRDRARQRAMAAAKSRRASPEELKEAGKRVKEIEQEMRELELRPETRKGEERAQRYGRLLRLRRMREAFTATRPQEEPRPLNSIALSLVMLFASVALCAFCVGGAYAGIVVLRQKPDPINTATAFWETMETQTYSQVVSTYLSPSLRVQYSNGLFEQTARTTDAGYGIIKSATLIQQSGDMQQTAILTYLVQRNASYKATITLRLHGGSWGIDDLGNTLAPDKAGLPEPTPSPTQTEPPTPTYPPSPTSEPSPSASP
ncbi:MAG TPA: hypothetical protein VJQ45_08520 [Ktedonobacterales bacterium]|nr:hypothetical protein [Ktedonobacterales bacterium]